MPKFVWTRVFSEARVNSTLERRKGASRTANIPDDVLEALNNGQLESVNLTEWLAVDAVKLLQATLPKLKIKNAKTILETARAVASQGVMQRTELIATALEGAQVNLETMTAHRSDTVRCWAAFIAVQRADAQPAKLEAIRPFAADAHFGVREIAWMAWRPSLAAELAQGIELLEVWTDHENPNIRRFASEASRPRGVWCAHIQSLKDAPELGLRVLEPLRADPHRYVQTSVANWLNDASKTRADWVETTCERWLKESPTSETKWIVNHALRSVRKSKP
jgi:3-methyladenine DNA glycosylase AlkC